MSLHYYFPTDFAKNLARQIEIFPMKDLDKYPEPYMVKKDKKKEARKKYKLAHDQWGRMMEFQTLSVTSSFKESMFAYMGYEITKEQKKVLKVIHKTTALWMKGQLSDNLLDKISSSQSGREIKDLTQTMMILMGIDSEDGQKALKGVQALVIQTYSEDK